MNPVISIIIRTYNSESFVKRAIESALNQSLPKSQYEILVIDDGSEDNTLRILETYKESIRIITTNHCGAIPALNLGIQQSKAELYTILDSDDALDSDLLIDLYQAMQPEDGFAYCDYYEINDESKKVITIGDNLFRSVAAAILFRKSHVIEVGLYDESLIFPEYDLLLKLSERKSTYVAKPLYLYYRREGSITSSSETVEQGKKQLEEKYKRALPIREYT